MMKDEEVSNLTDEQINVMVTKCVHDAYWCKKYDSENKWIYEDDSDQGVANGIKVADYCNDPAVMWPVMVDSCISVFIEKGLTNHMACVSSWSNCAFDIQLETYDENPLRAAAIVYLKIKGVL